MDYGINLPISSSAANADTIRSAARHAEKLGFSSLWVGDHVVIPTEPTSKYPYSSDGSMTWDPQTPWLDPILTLTWAAAATSKIRLGTAVLIVGMRPTVLVAKQIATLDQLSGGRLGIGVGVGWLTEEFEILGQTPEKRGGRMVDAIRYMRACWSDEIVRYEGPHHPATHPFAFQPKPAQAGGVPILIGAVSDIALKRVAEVGDGWLPIEMPEAAFKERLEVLDARLAEAGRRREDIHITLQSDADGFTPEKGAALEALGVSETIVEISWRANTAQQAMDLMSELADRLHIPARPE